MYKVSVPLIGVTAEEMGLEKHLENLKRLDAERVFIAIDKITLSDEKRLRQMKALKKCCDFFHAEGFEVGAWFWAFWSDDKDTDFVRMKGVDGRVSKQYICPSDKKYREAAAKFMKEVASCGVDLIQFDDDFRYAILDCGLGCVCENHLAYVRNVLGEDISEKELIDKAFEGGRNKYRTAWQESKKYYFELFAKEMRAAVDEINKNIRISLCSCLSVWDVDGADAPTLSRILAGSAKPIVRLIGAPYWAATKSRNIKLQNIIEAERMERSWCGDDIEIMSEGDVYPRPRTNCPANYVEIFDTALRASGEFDGILKYDIDYNSNPDYEDGYIRKHEKNRALYKKIEKHFGDKKCCGVRVYERMKKFEDMILPEEFKSNKNVDQFICTPASKLLADNTIPTVYDGEGVFGVAFAENIEAVPHEAMKKGIVIDLRAAEILKSRGIDTGLLSVGEKYTATMEHYDFLKNQYAVCNCVHDISVNDNAEILTRFSDGNAYDKPTRTTVGSYYYKNKNGQQFLVFSFYAYSQFFFDSNWYRSYMRSAEIKYAAELFGGEKLPAYSYGNPDLYIISKKNEKSTAVGLWNIFADEISEPVIELGEEYGSIEFINCSGRLEGNTVILSEIPPFGFAGFEVKK